MKNILKTLLILIITLILITTYVSVNASVAQDIYSSCEQKVIDNVKYYKLTSVAGIHKLKVQWSDAEKSVTTSYNGRNIVFNTVNDIVYINGERHYFGDIVLHNGFTYIPEDSITIFGEGYTAYQLNNSSNIKYVNGKITRIDIDANDKLTVTTLKKYDFNQSLYFCVEEFAEMYSMTTKVAEGDYIMIRNSTVANSEWGRIKSIVANTSITIEDNLLNAQTGSVIFSNAECYAIPVDMK